MIVYVVYKRYDNFDADRDDYAVKAVYTSQKAAEQYVKDHEYTKFVAMQVFDNTNPLCIDCHVRDGIARCEADEDEACVGLNPTICGKERYV